MHACVLSCSACTDATPVAESGGWTEFESDTCWSRPLQEQDLLYDGEHQITGQVQRQPQRRAVEPADGQVQGRRGQRLHRRQLRDGRATGQMTLRRDSWMVVLALDLVVLRAQEAIVPALALRLHMRPAILPRELVGAKSAWLQIDLSSEPSERFKSWRLSIIKSIELVRDFRQALLPDMPSVDVL
jgi:hypothetical protein